jgi:hypothetical protein
MTSHKWLHSTDVLESTTDSKFLQPPLQYEAQGLRNVHHVHVAFGYPKHTLSTAPCTHKCKRGSSKSAKDEIVRIPVRDKLEVGKYSQEMKISDMCMRKNERMGPFHPAPCVYRRADDWI